jgi:uncharacterized membrane protein
LTVQSNGVLGFVGALLTALGYVAQFTSGGLFYYPLSGFSGYGAVFGVLGFVGAILFLVAMNGLAKDYGDSAIFNNALYGFLANIVGAVVIVLLAVAVVFANFSNIAHNFNTATFLPSNFPEIFQSIIGYLIPVFVAASIVALIQAFLYMRAFKRLGEKSGMKLFKTAGLLFVISAAVTIATAFVGVLLIIAFAVSAMVVFAIPIFGGAVSLAAWILAAKAYYSLRATEASPSQPSTAPVSQVKYCPHCGGQNRVDAEYCVHCGKKQ